MHLGFLRLFYTQKLLEQMGLFSFAFDTSVHSFLGALLISIFDYDETDKYFDYDKSDKTGHLMRSFH